MNNSNSFVEDSDAILPWEEPKTSTSNREDITELDDSQDSQQKPLTSSSDETAELWRAMQEYHAMGLSMIWSRAEDETIKGERSAKTWSSEKEKRPISLKRLISSIKEGRNE